MIKWVNNILSKVFNFFYWATVYCLVISIVVMTIIGNAFALRSNGPLILGDGSATADAVVEVNNGKAAGSKDELRFNGTTGKWEKVENGIKTDIGAGGGGGGGQNFFTTNPGAEAGTTGWTNIGGGAFTTIASAPINGANHFSWDAQAQNDIIRTEVIEIPEYFKGKACQIEFKYTGGTSDLIKPQVTDSSFVKLGGATYRNQLDSSEFLKAQTGIVQRSLFFICPSSGDIHFQFNQTEVGNPSALEYDDVHIGENLGLVESFSGPKLFGTAETAEAADCVFTTNSLTLVTWPFDNDCPAPTVTGEALAPSTKIPGIRFATMPAGDYLFVATGDFRSSGTNFANHTYQFHDGTAPFGLGQVSADGTQRGRTGSVMGTLTLETAQSDVTIDIRARTSDVTNGATLDIRAGSTPLKISVFFYPKGDAQTFFRSLPQVAEFENELSVKWEQTGTHSILSCSTIPCWIDSVITDGGDGRSSLDPAGANFTVDPLCTLSSGGSVIRSHSMGTETTASLTTFSWDSANVLADTDPIKISCQRQGSDRRAKTTNLVLVNQVQSNFEAGLKTESCLVINSGTPVIDPASKLCEGWILSFTDNADGDTNVNFIAGTFSAPPICVITRGSQTLGVNTARTPTSSTVRVETFNLSSTLVDVDFNIKCTGAR